MDAKKVVKDYLDKRAEEDEQFAESYSNPHKSIDSCWKYILSEARKRGREVAMTDAEVFGLAVHYYDESDIEIVETESVVATTSAVELTEEEKAAAHKEAQKRYTDILLETMKKEGSKSKSRKKSQVDESTPSLFDL